MLDPVTIVGTAGAVANIIDILGNTISTAYGLRQQWKGADFVLLNLVSQLTALKAALGKIEEWMSTTTNIEHHQLIMDLDLIITCIRMLIFRVEDHLMELQTKADGSLTSSGKTQLVLGSSKTDELQGMIQNQTSALNLLLTACNCTTISEQRILVEKKSTRKVILQVEKDTASLVEVRDDESFLSRCSDGLSKLSMVFTFDRELFVTNVYDRALRNSMTRALQKKQGTYSSADSTIGTLQQSLTIDDKKQKRRSQAIESSLKMDEKLLRRECKILLLGVAGCGKDTLLRRIISAQDGGYSEQKRRQYRHAIYQEIVTLAKDLVTALVESSVDSELGDRCTVIDAFILDPDPDALLDHDFVDAVADVWKDPCISETMALLNQRRRLQLAPYFFDNITRLGQPAYVPTEDDVLKITEKTKSIFETKLTMGQLSLSIIDVMYQESQRKKWVHHFENVTSILYVVDLASYDQLAVSADGSEQNKIIESLVFFESVVKSRWFRRCSVVLFLTNLTLFRAKIASSPLHHHFLDFTGDEDVNKAAKYILRRFNQAMPLYSSLYPHLVETADESTLRFVFSAVKETILQNALFRR